MYSIGIRREDKSVWERRAPLTPEHLREILQKCKDLRFVVQPSKKRIFSDHQYEQAGAAIQEDMTQCSLILGIKEIPVDKLLPNKTFMYFSHTIKGQLQNMPALDMILEKNIRLIDYEKITDEKNNRLIAFGKYAGIAGAIDFLKGFGEYIIQMGINTPFLSANCAYKYFDIKECYSHLQKIGQKIKEKEIPKELAPMIFAITGRGRTANGVMEVLENLPITIIKPDQIETLWNDRENPIHRKTIYVASINTEDCMTPRDGSQKFDKNDFYSNPSKYRNNFKTKYLPYISALFHCIFWDTKYPKYIKNKHLFDLANTNNLRLIGICDVTCDLQGSIECLEEYTQPQKPFFYFDSLSEEATFDMSYKYGKFFYLGIDFLPCELAYDASNQFSILLKNWVENIVKSDAKLQLDKQGLLPELQRAVITSGGKLTSNFEYIPKMREENIKSLQNSFKKKKVSMMVQNGSTNTMVYDNVKVVPKEDIIAVTLDFN